MLQSHLAATACLTCPSLPLWATTCPTSCLMATVSCMRHPLLILIIVADHSDAKANRRAVSSLERADRVRGADLWGLRGVGNARRSIIRSTANPIVTTITVALSSLIEVGQEAHHAEVCALDLTRSSVKLRSTPISLVWTSHSPRPSVLPEQVGAKALVRVGNT